MCNRRHFQCSKGIEWCESVELSSLFQLSGPRNQTLGAGWLGVFFLSMAFGYESVELSSALGF